MWNMLRVLKSQEQGGRLSRPQFPPLCVLPRACIQRIREEQEAYDRDPEEYEQHEKEWSLEECQKRGCLPTGEPLEALFGPGEWSE